MKGNPEERAVQLGEYITETGATVRSAAKAFGISKSTVHKDITCLFHRMQAFKQRPHGRQGRPVFCKKR